VVGKFKGRHQLDFKILCGELKSANYLGVEDFKNIWIEKMKIYTLSEIYNRDETSLYYRSIQKSFVTKGDDCKGIKIKKDRITLLLCWFMIGEKQKPFIIGKSKNPRCSENY